MKLPPSEITPAAPLTPCEKVCLGLLALFPLIFGLAIAALVSGCVYRGAKVTEGTDLAIGLNVPVSEGTLQIQALNYLSGFRLAVDRNAVMTCKYSVSESNSFLGVVHTQVRKTMDATVTPLPEAQTNAPTATSCATTNAPPSTSTSK